MLATLPHPFASGLTVSRPSLPTSQSTSSALALADSSAPAIDDAAGIGGCVSCATKPPVMERARNESTQEVRVGNWRGKRREGRRTARKNGFVGDEGCETVQRVATGSEGRGVNENLARCSVDSTPRSVQFDSREAHKLTRHTPVGATILH